MAELRALPRTALSPLAAEDQASLDQQRLAGERQIASAKAARAVANAGRLHKASRRMKARPTKGEWAFWQLVKDSFLWQRQAVRDGYILDFYRADKKVCVEIDGSSHWNRKGADFLRDQHLAKRGIQTIRFSNTTVLKHPEQVQAVLATL